MKKRKKIDLPIYRRKIVAYIDFTFEEMEASIGKEFGISVEEWVTKGTHVGAVWTVKNKKTGAEFICFWSASKKDTENFTHEVFHLTDIILTDAGVKLSDDSNEAWAYLNGYLNKLLHDL